MKQVLILLAITSLVLNLKAQINETVYLDANYKKTKRRWAKYYKEFKWDDKTKTACIVKTFRRDDILLSKRSYTNYKNDLRRDTSIKYDLRGSVEYFYVYGLNNKKELFIDANYDGTIKTIKAYDTSGITYNVIQYSPFNKKEQEQLKEAYGSAKLNGDVLTESLYSYRDSTLSNRTSYIVKKSNDVERVRFSRFQKNGKPFFENYFHDNENGFNVKDSLYSYYKSGKIKRKEYYSTKLKKRSSCFTEAGSKLKFTPFAVDASFPGGEEAMFQWLSRRMAFPKYGAERGLHGIVYVDFVVDTDGLLSNFEIRKGIHELFDSEVLRTIKNMPKWNPAIQDDKRMKSTFTLPVQFLRPQ